MELQLYNNTDISDLDILIIALLYDLCMLHDIVVYRIQRMFSPNRYNKITKMIL